MKKRKVLALLLTAVMTMTVVQDVMLVSAADDSVDYSSNVLDDGRTIIHVALTGDPGTLDPFDTGDANSVQEIMTPVREGLAYLNPETLELEGRLAESWEVSDDALVYTVKLYDYIYDTAGNQFTAYDVEWYLNTAKERDIQSSSYVEDVEVVDDYTVIITLNSSDIGVWKAIATFPFCTQASYESADSFATAPVFTGPYMVTDYVVGSSVTIESRGDDYWQDPDLAISVCRQNVDVIDYEIITDSAQLTISLETGLVDVVDALDYLSAESFLEGGMYDGEYFVSDYENPLTQMMYLNMDESNVFANDEHLRNAMMYSIDVEGLIAACSYGYGVRAQTFGCEALASGYLDKWNDEDYFVYDFDYAQEELALSDYDGSTLRMVCSNSDLHQSICTVLQSYWLKLGINTEILPYDGALFNTYKNDAGEWEILIDNTSVGGPIQSLWRRKFDPANFAEGQGGANFIKEGELIDTLMLCINEATLNDEVTDQFHTLLKDMACARSLYNEMNFTVATPVMVQDYYEQTGFICPNACTYVWNE